MNAVSFSCYIQVLSGTHKFVTTNFLLFFFLQISWKLVKSQLNNIFNFVVLNVTIPLKIRMKKSHN